jgi:DNA-binding NarL/FixJ family response regulator
MSGQPASPAPHDTALRAVLADDSAIFRQGLALLLQAADVVVPATAGDVPSLLEAVQTHQPDVAVVDVRMPPTHTDEGIQAALALRRHHPGTGVVVLSTYVEPRWVTTLLEAEPTGVGYLLKDRVADIDGLLEALWRVAGGGIALDPEVVATLLAARRHTTALERLTEREREILALVAQGRSNAGIAETLFLSVKTVEAHVAAVFRSLDLHEDAADNRRVKAALAYLQAQ